MAARDLASKLYAAACGARPLAVVLYGDLDELAGRAFDRATHIDAATAAEDTPTLLLVEVTKEPSVVERLAEHRDRLRTRAAPLRLPWTSRPQRSPTQSAW